MKRIITPFEIPPEYEPEAKLLGIQFVYIKDPVVMLTGVPEYDGVLAGDPEMFCSMLLCMRQDRLVACLGNDIDTGKPNILIAQRVLG